MLKKIIPLFTLLISFACFSQNHFKGTVVEENTSMSITNAIIAIEETAFAQKTDLNGKFNFTETIPDGEYAVTITKDGYETKYVLIDVIAGKNIIMDNVKLEVTKDERKRREKALKLKQKEAKKERKERDKFLAESQKEKKKRKKELAKQKKKLKEQKEDDDTEDIVVYEDVEQDEPVAPLKPEVNSLQLKYGAALKVKPSSITNFKLYEFIEDWEGSDYLLGGADKEGIDCSSFTQRLFTSVYDLYIERTAEKQFYAKLTERFSGREHLKEGDLIFFEGSGETKDVVTHVGVYLKNNYFVHSTSYTKDNGLRGVKISNLEDDFWAKRFYAGGRRGIN